MISRFQQTLEVQSSVTLSPHRGSKHQGVSMLHCAIVCMQYATGRVSALEWSKPVAALAYTMEGNLKKLSD